MTLIFELDLEMAKMEPISRDKGRSCSSKVIVHTHTHTHTHTQHTPDKLFIWTTTVVCDDTESLNQRAYTKSKVHIQVPAVAN